MIKMISLQSEKDQVFVATVQFVIQLQVKLRLN